MDPLRLPLAQYIQHGDLSSLNLSLPSYSMVPEFKWDLTSLLGPEAEVDILTMDPSSTASIDTARDMLHAQSRLDPSQIDAVIGSLTRELALIQGPPGTGKVS